MSTPEDKELRGLPFGIPDHDAPGGGEETAMAIRACLANLVLEAEEAGLDTVAKFIDFAVMVVDTGMYDTGVVAKKADNPETA